MDFAPLKQYIDDSSENLRKMNEDIDDDEKMTLVYEIYANFLDLGDEIADIRKALRKKFKFTDTAVKKWLKEADDEKEQAVESVAEENPTE